MQILIIGGMSGQIGAASKIAVARGARVAHAPDIEDGLHRIRSGEGSDLVMIDTGLDVGKLVQSLKAERINTPVVACGVGDDSQSAVAAIKAGAQEYIPLPPDADMIAAVLEAATAEDHALVHRDPAMAETIALAEKIAASAASVLIVGESGTGKELIARHIHKKSPRAGKPFVAVNCAAIPENLLESELFGHEKGAFTGAVARRLGKFEEANGGTLLLDEISEMDPRLQAKLLRAIQEREIDRIGGKKPVKVDVRVIATSNRDMEAEVAAGNFREDLYYRLNVVTVELPALRDRPGDIEPLARHFTDKYTEANGLGPLELDEGALAKLQAHGWPGNVRELENTIHRGVLLAGGDVLDADAIRITAEKGAAQPAGGNGNGNGSGGGAERTTGSLVGRTVADVERDLIIDTLEHCLGNRTHAANILGISIRTLRNKLKQYSEEGVAVPTPGQGA